MARIVFCGFVDDRILRDDQLSDRTDALGRCNLDIADSGHGGCVDRESNLHLRQAGSFAVLLFRMQNFARNAVATYQNLIRVKHAVASVKLDFGSSAHLRGGWLQAHNHRVACLCHDELRQQCQNYDEKK